MHPDRSSDRQKYLRERLIDELRETRLWGEVIDGRLPTQESKRKVEFVCGFAPGAPQ